VTKTLLLTACMALFLVAAAPAPSQAEIDAPESTTTAPRADVATECADTLAGALWTAPDIGAQSDCTADCWDGTSRTCNAGSSCMAHDSSCSTQGYCWDDVSGYKFCPAYPPSCDDVQGTKCVTSNGQCFTGCGVANCFCFGGYWQCP
jgi:hypothetical protein